MPEQLGLFDRPDLSEEERAVYLLIRRGRPHAVSVRSIRAVTGMDDVRVRKLVKHLIEEHGVLICSATRQPVGYYLPETEDEYKAGAAQIVSRIRSLARRLRAVDRAAFETIFGNERITI